MVDDPLSSNIIFLSYHAFIHDVTVLLASRYHLFDVTINHTPSPNWDFGNLG